MAVGDGQAQMPGVVIPERFAQNKNDVGISPYALCSGFVDHRDLILSSGKDRYFVSRRLVGAFSSTVAAVSSEHSQIDLRSGRIDRLVRLFQGETVVLGGGFDASAAIAECAAFAIRRLGDDARDPLQGVTLAYKTAIMILDER
jgi:hypothetical protein